MMLISLSGLPGVGKTTVARELAKQISALHLEIDVIENAIREANPVILNGYREAYLVAQRLAEENLKLGLPVVADSLNLRSVTREEWIEIAKRTGAGILEVEIVCTDDALRRARIEAVMGRAEGTPPWEAITRSYQPWDRERLVIDTARHTVDEAVETMKRSLALV